LNILDTREEILPEYANPIFKSAMRFIDREIQNKKVLVHCNFGSSRSPSLGLTYLAIKKAITNDSFKAAANEFRKLYHEYAPGTGIILYMQHNWNFLMNELIP
jgi:protein-tyrosine phosphatase